MPTTTCIRWGFTGALIALLSGCATTPQPLRGDFYAPITPNEAALDHRTGAYVRWGGQILSVVHEKNRTCFDVLGRPLDSRAKPERTDALEGRYRACAAGFYDPAVYEEGRAITTTGVIEHEATTTFDSYDLRMPVVSADVVYLWPRRVYYPAPYPAYPFYGYGYGWGYGVGAYAYGYPWGPYWGPSWGPRWGPWWGVGWAAPYYGYGGGYRYRQPYRYGHGGRGKRSPTRAARMVRGGRGGNVGGNRGQRVPVGRR